MHYSCQSDAAVDCLARSRSLSLQPRWKGIEYARCSCQGRFRRLKRSTSPTIPIAMASVPRTSPMSIWRHPPSFPDDLQAAHNR